MQKEEKNTINKIQTASKAPIGFHIEIDKEFRDFIVTLQSVSSVIDISSDEIIMKAGKGRVKICGSGLEITVFENKTVEVFGKVGAVEFI